ncbi:MAG: ABC transporter substrate-binding protein [Methanobacterium sp.]|jgi:NitT/TauT family transport system substrate-binding protein
MIDRKKIVLIAVAAVAIVGAIVILLGYPQPRVEDVRPKIVVADAPTTHHLNLYVAEEKGLFEKHGVDVEIVKAESLPAARDAVVTGAADVFWSCPTIAIAAIGGGAPIRTIAQVKIPCTSVLLVPADSPIQDYKDLEGKTIAGISPACEAVLAITSVAKDAGAEFNLSKMDGGTPLPHWKLDRLTAQYWKNPTRASRN